MFWQWFFAVFKLALWAADENGGAGAVDDGDPTGGAEPGQDPKDSAGGDPPAEPTFTQDDLNRITGKARRQALGSFAKELGLESADDIRALVEAKKAADDQAKSETERLQGDLSQAQQINKQLRADYDDLLLRSQFDRVAAAEVADLDLAFLAARQDGLLSADAGVEINPESKKVSGLDAAVKQLLKDRPILKKQGQAAAGDTAGAAGGNGSPGASKVDEAAIKARYGI